MFNSDRQFPPKHYAGIVETQKQSLAARQRNVYDSHRHRIFSLAFYMVGNEPEAEEVLAASFVRAFEQIEEPDGNLVDCSLVDELRGRLPFEEGVAPVDPKPLRGLEANVGRTDMEEALRELPTQERLIFLLRDVEGYAPDRIASLLQLPVERVNGLVISARLRMRQVLALTANERAERAA